VALSYGRIFWYTAILYWARLITKTWSDRRHDLVAMLDTVFQKEYNSALLPGLLTLLLFSV
jgi:hypothetical protein